MSVCAYVVYVCMYICMFLSCLYCSILGYRPVKPWRDHYVTVTMQGRLGDCVTANPVKARRIHLLDVQKTTIEMLELTEYIHIYNILERIGPKASRMYAICRFCTTWKIKYGCLRKLGTKGGCMYGHLTCNINHSQLCGQASFWQQYGGHCGASVHITPSTGAGTNTVVSM